MSFIHSRHYAENLHRATDFAGDNPLSRADADMAYVLDALAQLEGRPIERCSPLTARRQPGLSAAVAKLLADQGRDGPDSLGVGTEMTSIETPAGEMMVRLYRGLHLDPTEKVPVLLYLHGGWIVGGLDDFDMSARVLARKTGAIVAAPLYRQAPEHPFPAAHEDAYAAWLWLIEAAESLGGNRQISAVAGEGMGANLALNIALEARNEAILSPLHIGLVTPWASHDFSAASFEENARSSPLNTAMVRWMIRHGFADRNEADGARMQIAARDDLGGVGPVTLILAELDPLRSGGEALAAALHAQGVSVDATTYDGVSHGFFGLGAMVNKAMFAQTQLAQNLVEAFANGRRKG